MPDRRTRSYPPVGAPDRLDQIVRRGRSLRRRRQAGMAAAGTGGTLAVAALVLSAMAVFSGGDPDDGVIADESAPTTTVVTTTTVAEDPDEMTVDIKGGSPVLVIVDDPIQPVGEGTRQCVEVAAVPAGSSSEAVPDFRGFSCREGTGSGAQPVELRMARADGTDVPGCAPVLNAPGGEPTEYPSERGTTTFTITELPPGEYRLEAAANSGIGDGCGIPEEWEPERRAVAPNRTVTVPAS